MPVTADLTGQNLGGLTLTPGVYHFDSAAQLTGTLDLNAEGNNNAYWVFQIGSAADNRQRVVCGGDQFRLKWRLG